MILRKVVLEKKNSDLPDNTAWMVWIGIEYKAFFIPIVRIENR